MSAPTTGDSATTWQWCRDDARMRRVLIANPGASRVTEARLAAVADALAPVEVLRTERSGHAVELARDVGAATLFVLGG